MAKISISELAPTGEPIGFSLGATEFSLEGPAASFETNDVEVIGNALAHPWLTVKEEVEVEEQSASEAEELYAVIPVLDAVDNNPGQPVGETVPAFADSQQIEEPVVNPVEEAPVEDFAPVPFVSDEQEGEF